MWCLPKKKLGGDGGEINRHAVVSCGRDAWALHAGGSSPPHAVPGTCSDLWGFWLSCCGGGSAARKQLALSWVGQGGSGISACPPLQSLCDHGSLCSPGKDLP